MKSTLTSHLRMVVTDINSRTVLDEARIGRILLNASSISTSTIALDKGVELGAAKTALYVSADGPFELVLTVGTNTVVLPCMKFFAAYAAFDAVTIRPSTPEPSLITTAKVIIS